MGAPPTWFLQTPRMFLWDEDPGHLSASMKQLGKFYIWVMEDQDFPTMAISRYLVISSYIQFYSSYIP